MYTKGKWAPYQLSSNNVSICVKTEGDLVAVEIASLNTLLGYDTVTANARLIAAAVNGCVKVNPDNPQAVAESIHELYEALRKAEEDINWMLNNRQFLNPDVFDYLEQALAKARGE